jgi:hypothetical protein
LEVKKEETNINIPECQEEDNDCCWRHDKRKTKGIMPNILGDEKRIWRTRRTRRNGIWQKPSEEGIKGEVKRVKKGMMLMIDEGGEGMMGDNFVQLILRTGKNYISELTYCNNWQKENVRIFFLIKYLSA